MRFFLKLFCLTLLISNCACLSRVEKEGYIFDNASKTSLLENVTTKEKVLKIMGSPTIVSDLEEEVFIYLSQDVKKLLFFKPKIIKREILVINFSKNNTIKSLASYDLTKGRNISFSKKYTKVDGKETSAIAELFGNIGHVGTY